MYAAFLAFWRRLFGPPAPVAAPSPAPPYVVPLAPVAPVTPPAAPLSLAAFAKIASPPGYSPLDIVRAVAAGYYPKVDDGGWIGMVDETGRLDISRAKQLWLVMLRGLADADALYVDRALTGISGVLSRQGPDGGFPDQDFGEKKGQHSIHHKSITLCEIAQALYAVKASAFYIGARMSVIDSLIARLGVTAVWLMNSDDMRAFFKDTDGQCNQFLSVISFLHSAGLLTGNDALQAAARAKMEWLFANMVSPDGVFREKYKADGVGFDTVYQLFSMKLLACYIMLLPPGLWRDNCTGRLRLGLRRWVQVIDPATGVIDDSDSSRTVARDALTPGKIDTWDSAATCFQLHLGHYVAGPDGFAVPLDVIALQQIKHGQTFLHKTEE